MFLATGLYANTEHITYFNEESLDYWYQ